MNGAITRPGRVQVNAWSPPLSNSAELPETTPWAHVAHGHPAGKLLAPGVPADERDWRDPAIGWGLVLPDKAGLPRAALLAAEDAPLAIRRLLATRPGSPVLRWSPGLGTRYLRRYYEDSEQDLAIDAPAPGTQRGQMPRYLLIYASPAAIPWEVQYALNMSTFVGRLDLEGDALERYVDALVSDWAGMQCQPRAPLVWSVNHGAGDITWLMERALADKLWQRLDADRDMTFRRRLGNEQSTCAALSAGLAERSPALVVTTSHGMTGPLDDAQKLTAQLGMPVDVDRRPLRVADLSDWRLLGAIWYAHACCSAGSDSVSRYADLLADQADVSKTINGVPAATGTRIEKEAIPGAFPEAEKEQADDQGCRCDRAGQYGVEFH